MSDQESTGGEDLEPSFEALVPAKIYVTFSNALTRISFGPFVDVGILTDPIRIQAYDTYELASRDFCLATWTGTGWQVCGGTEEAPPIYDLVRFYTGRPPPDGPI